MAAGLSEGQKKYHTRAFLGRVERKAREQGFSAPRARGASTITVIVPFNALGAPYRITFGLTWSSMSNGESVGTYYVTVEIVGSPAKTFTNDAPSGFWYSVNHRLAGIDFAKIIEAYRAP